MIPGAVPNPADARPAGRVRADGPPGCDRARRRALRALAAAPLVLALAGSPAPAQAAEPLQVLRASLEPSSDGEAWLLSADFAIELNARLVDAVNRGVPLYFVVDFALVRPRWWWFDERTVELSRTWRLAYHALTRQYRLAVEGLQQRFDTLDDALAALARVRGWRVIDRERARDAAFMASVRMRLDMSQLPKPFQVSAITERDWNLQSEWKAFPFRPETAKSAP